MSSYLNPLVFFLYRSSLSIFAVNNSRTNKYYAGNLLNVFFYIQTDGIMIGYLKLLDIIIWISFSIKPKVFSYSSPTSISKLSKKNYSPVRNLGFLFFISEGIHCNSEI